MKQKVNFPLVVILIILLGVSLLVFAFKYDFSFSQKEEQQKEKQEKQEEQEEQIEEEEQQEEDQEEIDTSDWETYRNEEYGVEFKYPKVYGSLQKIDSPKVGGLGTVPADFKARSSEKFGLSVAVASMNIYKFSSHGGDTTRYSQSDKECIIIGGENESPYSFKDMGGCFISTMDMMGGMIGYVIPNNKNGKIIEIQVSFSGEDVSFKEMSQILDEILSTFEFLELEKSFEEIAVFGSVYSEVKIDFLTNGWIPIIPDNYEYESGTIINKTPIDPEFPEISRCGSGQDKICNIDFKKNGERAHINIVSENNEWIITGTE